MFRYENLMTFRNWHGITGAVTCLYYKLQMFWKEGLCRGGIRMVALDKMESTHTPQRRGAVPSVTNRIIACRIWRCPEDTKNTERAPKVLEMECGSHFFPLFFPLFFFFFLVFFFSSFFFFYFSLLRYQRRGKHTESKRLAESPNTVVQLKS